MSENLLQLFFDPDGIALPGFYCVNSQEYPWCFPPGPSHSLTDLTGSVYCRCRTPVFLWLWPTFLLRWNWNVSDSNFDIYIKMQKKRLNCLHWETVTRWHHKILKQHAVSHIGVFVLFWQIFVIIVTFNQFNWGYYQSKVLWWMQQLNNVTL